jgi:hypothetical protein
VKQSNIYKLRATSGAMRLRAVTHYQVALTGGPDQVYLMSTQTFRCTCQIYLIVSGWPKFNYSPIVKYHDYVFT